MKQLLAQGPFGQVAPPPGVNKFEGGTIRGVSPFLTVIIQTLIVGAGIYALFNIILAGYAFLSAGGDAKQVAAAWAKIWQSILGIVVVAGSLVIAALIGILLFGNATAILWPQVYTP